MPKQSRGWRRRLAYWVAIAFACAMLGVTPLYYLRMIQLQEKLVIAVEKNEPARVEELLNEGASPDVENVATHHNPLSEFVRRLLHLPNPGHITPPLIVAVSYRSPQSGQFSGGVQSEDIAARLRIVRLLLSHNPDVNVRNNEGALALSIACWQDYEHPEFARMLISAGANANLEDETLLSGNSAGIPSVFRAAVRDSIDPTLIKLMMDHGASVDAADEYGHTSLMMCRKAEIMRLLLMQKPNVNKTDSLGLTALDHMTPGFWEALENDVIARKEVAEMKRLLLAAGARPSPQ